MKKDQSISLESVKKELQTSLTFMHSDYYEVNPTQQRQSVDFIHVAKSANRNKLGSDFN